AVGADAVVGERGAAARTAAHGLVNGGHHAVRGQVAGADLVVIRDLDEGAVHALLLDHRFQRRGRGRDPHRRGYDVAPHARPDVGDLVRVVLLTVGGHLGAPAADGGSPAHQRDAL